MTIITNDNADALKNIRLGLKLSQTGFSKKVGVSQGYISKVESKKRNLSDESLIDFAAKLGYTVSITRKITIK